MPTYSYTAINPKGLKKKGILSAASEREARKFIKDLQLTPISVSLSKNKSSLRTKIKNKDVVLMTRQLATLLEANTSIVDALKITADQLYNKDLISIILNLREDVVQGKRLGQSMKKYPDVFNNTYSSLVTAGDSSGNLDGIFNFGGGAFNFMIASAIYMGFNKIYLIGCGYTYSPRQEFHFYSRPSYLKSKYD